MKKINARIMIQKDFTGGKPTKDFVAPTGPFSEWRIQIRESENKGLDLSGVADGYIEFWGRNVCFKNN